MSKLSIFIDESGDFGDYDYHSPYYIISMVYHDQMDAGALSHSELEFFGSPRDLKKSYLKPLIKKEWV